MSGQDLSAGTPDPESSASLRQDEPEAASAVDSIKVLVTCVLAWAVPGLGHVATGRIARGVVFGLVVLSLFRG